LQIDVAGVHIYTERNCGNKCKGNFKETIITMVIPKRMTAKMEGSFCVFLIGMRINRSWKMHKWLPVFLAMPRMLTELRRQPDLGFIGGHVWFGRTILLLQYWQSFGALIRYAKNSDLAHLPAWARFRDNIGDSGDVGIWHETYLISEGQYESIYHNMPAFGLGRVGQLVEATGPWETASKRIHSRSELDSSTKAQGEYATTTRLPRVL
jgi:hypothetical protein